MANTLVESFRIRDTRKKIFFTLGILIITRIGAYLPIPGINPSAVLKYFNEIATSNSQRASLAEYLNFFSGGAFSNFSLFMLGVMPYISTQIIIQLLMIVIPSLKKLAEDPQGSKKIQQYTRYGTILVCAIQATAASVYARSIPGAIAFPESSRWAFIPIAIISVTAGSMLMVWLGEKITQYGIGNGISLLIFAGIVARIPNAIFVMSKGIANGTINIASLIVVIVMFFFVVALVIYEEKGERKITIQYSRQQRGNRMYSRPDSKLPIKINPSGVIPVIFASTLLQFPLQIGYNTSIRWMQRVAQFLNPQGAPYLIIYTLLIVGFAYFYTNLTLRPNELAENIRSNGGTVPGISSGYLKDDKGQIVYNKTTGKPKLCLEAYFEKVINSISFSGSIFLAFIALIPTLVQIGFHLPAEVAMLFGGTSLIILVGVDLDTMNQLEAEVKKHGITKDYKSKKRKTRRM